VQYPTLFILLGAIGAAYALLAGVGTAADAAARAPFYKALWADEEVALLRLTYAARVRRWA